MSVGSQHARKFMKHLGGS